jgi:hypothetical protein
MPFPNPITACIFVATGMCLLIRSLETATVYSCILQLLHSIGCTHYNITYTSPVLPWFLIQRNRSITESLTSQYLKIFFTHRERNWWHVQILCFWTLSIILLLSKALSCSSKHSILDTEFCLHLPIKLTQLGPVAQMGEKMNAYRMLVIKAKGKRSLSTRRM